MAALASHGIMVDVNVLCVYATFACSTILHVRRRSKGFEVGGWGGWGRFSVGQGRDIAYISPLLLKKKKSEIFAFFS